jgi:hypothetical protein
MCYDNNWMFGASSLAVSRQLRAARSDCSVYCLWQHQYTATTLLATFAPCMFVCVYTVVA